VLATNPLRRLEAFDARDAPGLGLASARALLHSCPRLGSLLDLATWGGAGEAGLAALGEEARRANLALELGGEEARGAAGASVLQLCRAALTERYGRVAHWTGED
jgi:hypothetical protein